MINMILPRNFSPVAYFCAEFAIDNDLPTYAGGLGILAGDYMNAAAQAHYETIGIGILYKGRSFVQHVTGDGEEEKRDSEFDHDTSFLRPTTIAGKQVILTLPSNQGEVAVKAYHLRLSDESIIFFLSTDVDQNPAEWIGDMDTLYHGDTDSQLRQEILLGAGGMKLMDVLGIKPRIYHINEGRPAFLIWHLAHKISKEENISFNDAWQRAKSKIVYTNHTLVAAGNPTYPLESITRAAAPLAEEYGVDVTELVKEGLEGDGFSITKFALNISAKHSAVSKVHGDFSKKQYPDYNWEAITNGIHLPRWQDSEMRNPSLSDHELWHQH